MLELKPQPHSAEAEQALIGAMLERSSLINDCDHLTEEDFYIPAHKVIYRRLQAMAMQNTPADPVTLCNALTASDELESAGGVEYIADLVSSSRGASNAKHYAQIISERSQARKLIAVGRDISELGYDSPDISAGVDQAQSLVLGLTSKGISEPTKIKDLMRDAVDYIDKRFHAKEKIFGLKTGIDKLDEMTSGFMPGQLVIVAGRPSMGKSTLAMNMVEAAGLAGKFAVVFNLEMDKNALTLRMAASLGKIYHDRIKSGQLEQEDWPKLTAAVTRIKDADIFIDDDPSRTSLQVLSATRRIAGKVGRSPDLVVVDYLQLLNDKGEGTDRITKISRALKMTAKALRCPVVALSQLNRGVEARPNKRPLMSDLRESGAIEQDADIIIFVYRDEFYNKESPDKGIAEIIVAKNRDGGNGTVYTHANLSMLRFENLAPEYVRQEAEQQPRGPFKGYTE